MELGARPRKRRVLLGWCWECGEKAEAGNSCPCRGRGTDRTMLKKESKSLGGEGAWILPARNLGVERHCRIPQEILSCKDHPSPYTVTPTPPSEASQASLPFPPS